MENKKHTKKVIAEPEVVQDGEFMLEPVPENKRRSTRSQIMVWIGFGYAVTGLIVAVRLVAPAARACRRCRHSWQSCLAWARCS